MRKLKSEGRISGLLCYKRMNDCQIERWKSRFTVRYKLKNKSLLLIIKEGLKKFKNNSLLLLKKIDSCKL